MERERERTHMYVIYLNLFSWSRKWWHRQYWACPGDTFGFQAAMVVSLLLGAIQVQVVTYIILYGIEPGYLRNHWSLIISAQLAQSLGL